MRINKFIHTCFLQILLLICIVTSLQGQAKIDTISTSEQKSFWITDIGYAFRLNDFNFNGTHSNRRHSIFSEFGYMKFIAPKVAIGGGLLANYIGGGEFRAAIKFRSRYILSNKMSIDISPGIVFWDTRFGSKNTSGSYFINGIDLNLNDFFAVTTQFETGNDTLGTGFYLGIKFGGKPGKIANSIIYGGGTLLGVIFLAAGYTGN